MKALIVAGAAVMAGGLGVGVAFAAGNAPSGHASSAPVEHPSSQNVSTTVAPPTTVPAPATAPAAVATTVPATAPPPAAPPVSAAASSSNSTSGHDGTLSATLTASTVKGQVGEPIDFTVTVSDSAATGPEGMQWIHYGDGGTSPVTGFPAGSRYCTAASAPAVSTSDFQHAFAASGTYAVTVLAQAPCSGETVTLTLPITVS